MVLSVLKYAITNKPLEMTLSMKILFESNDGFKMAADRIKSWSSSSQTETVSNKRNEFYSSNFRRIIFFSYDKF